MIAFIAQAMILIAAIAVMMVCAVIWLLLIARMWATAAGTFAVFGTIWAVLIFGTIAALTGMGAYTVAFAAFASLLGAP